MTWIVGLLALVIGGALGAVITKVNQKDTDDGSDKIKELEEQLAKAQQASNDYQDKVSEHFVKTSELFGEMTENYRTAYLHLATGAQSLCKPGTEAALLKTSLVEQLSLSETTQKADEQIGVVTMADSDVLSASVDGDISGVEATATVQEAHEEPVVVVSSENKAIQADDAQSKSAETHSTMNEGKAESNDTASENVTSLNEPVVETVQAQDVSEKTEEGESNKTLSNQPLPEAIKLKSSDDSSRPSIH